MSCRFSEAVSCTMESSYITPTSPSSGRSTPMPRAQARRARATSPRAPARAHGLPVGREVHARVGDRRPHDAERRPHGARADLLRDAGHAHDPPVPVEAHRADPVRAVVAHDVHLQLVEKRAARKAPRDERTLPHALGVPRQRHHHASVVVPHAHQAPPHVHPHRKGARAQAERPHHRLLGPSPEVRGREERRQPVGALPALACHHSIIA